MLLLSIDTSTAVCSVALHDGPRLLACYELFTERTSSALLTTLIGDVVRHAGYDLKQLDAVAVAKGPGSYTGLRIGVSTAKGLCFALDKPLLAVNTLQAMAEQVATLLPQPAHSPVVGVEDSPALVLCPMIDARRMEVYCALYDEHGTELTPTNAAILDETSFADVLTDRTVLFFGDGAAKARPLLETNPNARFLSAVVQPSARTVGTLAAARYADGRFENLTTFEPFYLKEFMGTKPRKAVV